MPNKNTQVKATTEKATESHENTLGLEIPSEVKDLVNENANKQGKKICEPKTAQIDKSKAVDIITSAKARVSRTAQTSISMSCREVLAMLNGIKDSIEKL